VQIRECRSTTWETSGSYGLKPVAKTALSLRTIAVPAEVIAELRQHRAKQAEERLLVGRYWKDLDLIFTRPGGEICIPSAVSADVGKLARAAGLPSNVQPLHGLRHAVGTMMMARVPLKAASAHLRHSGVRITADLYQHASIEVDRQAVQAIQPQIVKFIRGSTKSR